MAKLREMNPASYSSYVRLRASQGYTPDSKVAKFAARYRMARQLTRIEFVGQSEISQEAYTAVLRLSLAYSALEILTKLLKPQSIAVSNSDVANQIRNGRGKFLLTYFNSALDDKRDGKVLRSLAHFQESTGSSDVRPVIEAIRHLTFHGVLNPTVAKLRTKYAIFLVSALTESLFQTMDLKMTEIYDRAHSAIS